MNVLSNDDYLVNGDIVYYKGKVVEGANGKTFKLLERFASYGSDGQFMFFEDQKMSGVDLTSAEVFIRESVLKDAKHVYWHARRVDSADVKTFTRSHADYSKYDSEDKYYYYKDGERVAQK